MAGTLEDSLRPWAGRRVLITGASGFLGRHLVRQGLAAGVELHAFGRRSVEGCAFYLGDFEDSDSVTRAVRESAPDGIIHLAAAGVGYGQGNAGALQRVNASGLATLLEAAAERAGDIQVVCAGSGFEYAPGNHPHRETEALAPNSAYGASKAAATAIAAFYSQRLPVTVLRPFSVYGVGEPPARFAAYIMAKTLAGESVDLTAGEQIRDYTDAADVAEAFWRALATPHKDGQFRVLNVACGRLVTLRDFAEQLAARLESAGLKPSLQFGARPYRPDELMYYCADVSRLRETLSWVPPTSLEEGLDRLVCAALNRR